MGLTNPMIEAITGRLIIISGPSCVGKTPLVKSLRKYFPSHYSKLNSLVLYNSRQPRPGEEQGSDYHFISAERIDEMRTDPSVLVFEVRGDLQALRVDDLLEQLKTGDVLYEGNTFIGEQLMNQQQLGPVHKVSIFISPVSKGEIQAFYERQSSKSFGDFVQEMMMKKLIRRSKNMGVELTPSVSENLERRAAEAVHELKKTHLFTHVIPNHDGEDSEHWDTFPVPAGDALKTLNALVHILDGKPHPSIESWKADLIR
jgi:guanylate kinase